MPQVNRDREGRAWVSTSFYLDSPARSGADSRRGGHFPLRLIKTEKDRRLQFQRGGDMQQIEPPRAIGAGVFRCEASGAFVNRRPIHGRNLENTEREVLLQPREHDVRVPRRKAFAFVVAVQPALKMRALAEFVENQGGCINRCFTLGQVVQRNRGIVLLAMGCEEERGFGERSHRCS